MKTIITHKRPHLDEVCATWLLHRYHPDFKKFRLRFVAQTSPLAMAERRPKSNEVLIGIGRGEFDEHSGKMEDSAATLVYKFLHRSGFLPEEAFKRRAIEAIVEHVRMGDFAETFQYPFMAREFLPDAVLGGWQQTNLDAVSVRKGLDLIEALYLHHREWQRTEVSWQKRKDLRIGRLKAAAVEGFPLSHIDRRAYDEGYDFVISVDTKYGRRQFRAAADSRVDFTPVYNFLIQKDTDGHWYLHHTGKILISSGEPHSSLSLEELIDVARKVL